MSAPDVESPRVWPKHLFRIASLVVPSWGAWYVTYSASHPGDLLDGVAYTLGGLWVLLTSALIVRGFALAAFRARHAAGVATAAPLIAQIDVLTSAGSVLAWLAPLAIMGAVWLGWPAPHWTRPAGAGA